MAPALPAHCPAGGESLISKLENRNWKLETRNSKLDRDGCRLLLEAAENERDKALLRMLHDLALRRGECVALDLEDVDLEAGVV